MRNFLDAIGIASNDKRSIEQALKQAANEAVRRETTGQGETRFWQAGSGAGLVLRFMTPKWRPAEQIQSDPLDGLTGVTPVHAGKSAIEVRLQSAEAMQASDPMAGGIRFELPSLRTELRPIVAFAEVAHFVPERWAQERARVRLQVAVFAKQVTAYRGLAEFFSVVSQWRLLAPGAVVPELPDDLIGMSLRGTGAVHRPISMVGGVVREMRRLTNVMTSKDYFWLLVDSEHGAFDVLVNQAAVHGDLAPGRIVQAIGPMVARELPASVASGKPASIALTPEAKVPSAPRRQPERANRRVGEES